MKDGGIIDNAISFLEKLRDPKTKFAIIKFIKKDGSIRLMKCTLDFDKIPKDHLPKNVNLPQILKLLQKNKIVRVYDLEKMGWRSVPFDKVEWIETNDKVRYRIREDILRNHYERK